MANGGSQVITSNKRKTNKFETQAYTMTDNQIPNRAEEIFFEIHRDNPREEPGNFEATRKAYSALSNLPDKPVILDIGCGPGSIRLLECGLSCHTGSRRQYFDYSKGRL
jgi:hypothetical protein